MSVIEIAALALVGLFLLVAVARLLRRPLKLNIPYNKKSAFQKAAAQLCAAAFFASALPK